MNKVFELKENELSVIIDEIKKFSSGIVLLRGDLASGKTTLVKNFVKAIGYDDLVTSPTFSIQSVYNDHIFHYDIYNKSLEEFVALGLLEEFEKDGLHFVEWGDDKLKKILDSYGFDNMSINIEKCENKRRYIINA